MNKTTKIFLIFIAIAFVIVTLLIMFGGYSYQLSGLNKHRNANNAETTKSDSGNSVDLSAYSEVMHTKIASKWNPPSVDKDVRVVAEFTIQKNGHIINEKIYTSSGDKEVDDSAIKALRRASPLPPLPLNLPQNSITVKFDFVLKSNK